MVWYDVQVMAANIKQKSILTYLDYIGAKFRTDEIRCHIMDHNGTKERRDKQLQAEVAELQFLEREMNKYLNSVLNYNPK
jgi:hypothetical protein